MRGALQKRLLARMRGLGMTTVLSAFAGHVPKALIDKHPGAKFIRSADWGHMPDPYGSVYMLAPEDPLFAEIGNKFIAKQAEEWGTDHVYSCDTYNEMDPGNSSAAFLQASARAVLAAMDVADPAAVWLMQGWLFHHRSFWGPEQVKAYLTAVPNDRQWILDLNSESGSLWQSTSSFYGKPFIWCTLLVYGGRQGYYGNLDKVYSGYSAAVGGNTTVTGVGITMEGIWTNYPIFEGTLLLGWERDPAAATTAQYWADFGRRRYGRPTAGAAAAWTLLGNTVYSGEFATTLGPIELGLPRAVVAAAATADAAGEAGLVQVWAPGCNYTKVVYSFLYRYAPGYSPGAEPKPYDDSSLAAAQAWCCSAGPSCGGVTLSKGRYEARASCTAHSKSTGETSWAKRTCATPDPGPPAPGPGPGPRPRPGPAPATVVGQVWAALLAENSTLASVPSYRFDLVDVAREHLEFVFGTKLQNFTDACSAKDRAAAAAAAAAMEDVLDDYDAVLSSDPNFMLGTWIAWARSPEWSNVTAHRDWLEFNARNQITLWGPTGQINDYAAKAWGGLVRDYYKPRWQLYTSLRRRALEPDTVPFDPAAFHATLLHTIEEPWSNATKPFPTAPEHDAVAESARLYAKYVGAGAGAGVAP